MPLLTSCCRCMTLKTGTLVSGIAGIIIAIISLIILLTTDVEFRTIIIDSLSSEVVKIILAINLIMTIIISALLIVGAIKRNWFMMMPWVVLGIMLIIGLLISVIYTAVVLFLHDNTVTGILWLVLGILSILIYTYMWMVVFSFFQIVREEDGRGAYAKPPFRR